MTTLEKILTLLDDYDSLVDLIADDRMRQRIAPHLDDLREAKDELAKELIEHGCRRAE